MLHVLSVNDGDVEHGNRISISRILGIVEDVLREVLEEYGLDKSKECNCDPDMQKVEKMAIQEGMTTQEILKLCSAISAAGKGQYGK